MNDNEKMEKEVNQVIKKITPLSPEIFYRKGTLGLTVVWRKNGIPSEQETAKIEAALKDFGDVVPNSCRDANYVSFLILG